MEIAVLVNENNQTSLFTENGKINVYEKSDNKLIRQLDYQIENLHNGDDLRAKMAEIGNWLGSCKVLVVKRIRGIYYLALERYQISILEIDGIPHEFLPHLQECDQHQRKEQKVPMEAIAIHESQPGYYYIDLKDVMAGKTSYNSKQVLIPFFKENTFTELEIICNHIPKWFDQELSSLNLCYESKAYNRCLKVTVSPQQ